MSVLDRFEKSVEGAVNGVFSKFGSKDLKPVDLSSALEREIDAEAMPVGRDRTVARTNTVSSSARPTSIASNSGAAKCSPTSWRTTSRNTPRASIMRSSAP